MATMFLTAMTGMLTFISVYVWFVTWCLNTFIQGHLSSHPYGFPIMVTTITFGFIGAIAIMVVVDKIFRK